MSEEGFLKQEENFPTRAIHGGFEPQQEHSWPLVPSITISTTFAQEAPDWDREYVYARIKNPTRQLLERKLAKIENAKYALCFASGLGAVTTIASLLNAGSHIVAGESLYGGTFRIFDEIFSRMNIPTTFVDTRHPEHVEAAIKENTKLVWVETPTNPLMIVSDIARLSEIVHKHKDIILVVDNTFLTPYCQRPLELGADISMYSLTKYMNGHTDAIMGSIVTNSEDLYKKLYELQHAMGVTPSPFDCYQVQRSLKTLNLRMAQHLKNSITVAKYLESKDQVEKVLHPGLHSHPQHSLMKKQCSGAGGMLSFYIKGGLDETKLFTQSLKMIKYAGSLGGYSTTVLVPTFMSHIWMPTEKKNELGITNNLVRMSVGLESADDIIADLEQAFQLLK